jgi:hypothetical protein
MSVETHVEPLGQRGAALHEFGGHAERRAGRERDANHGAEGAIMVASDLRFAFGQDGLVVLHDRIRWQPAVLFAQRHRPARRVKSDAQIHRSRNGRRQQIAPALRMEIEMIGTGGAA